MGIKVSVSGYSRSHLSVAVIKRSVPLEMGDDSDVKGFIAGLLAGSNLCAFNVYVASKIIIIHYLQVVLH